MQPGWYPDPFTPHGLRWWDGAQWTAWTHPGASTITSGGGDPATDLAAEDAAGRRASIGLIVAAVINVATIFTSAVVSHRLLRDAVHQIRVAADNPQAPPRLHINTGTVLYSYGLGLVQLALQVLLMIWLYRAATFARRAGLPARRDPVWAWAGYLVPVVNFWFPYQVAADTVPPGHRARSLALHWWWCYLGQSGVAIAVVAVSYFSTAVALACALVGAVVAIFTARYGRAMITAVVATHGDIASGVAPPDHR